MGEVGKVTEVGKAEETRHEEYVMRIGHSRTNQFCGGAIVTAPTPPRKACNDRWGKLPLCAFPFTIWAVIALKIRVAQGG